MKGYDDPLKRFIMKTLQNVYYMEKISSDSLEEIAYYLGHLNIDQDQILFRAGEKVDTMYFIANGTVDIIVALEDHEIIMDSLGEGCVIGYNGILFSNHYHTFTVKARTKASIYTLNKETLKHIQNTCDDLYNEISDAKKYYIKETKMIHVDF